MAADLTIGPVSDGQDAYKVVVFGLTKGTLDHVAIQTGSNDLIGRPLSLVGDENVFPKLLSVETDPVVVLPGEEPPLQQFPAPLDREDSRDFRMHVFVNILKKWIASSLRFGS